MTIRSNKLLLIEDNPLEAELLREQLQSFSRPFALQVCPDAESALKYFAQEGINSVRPDLVILDLNLPRVSGFEFLKQFKTNPNTKDIPVLVLTTSQQPSDIMESYALFANAFMTKPFNLEGYAPILDVIYSLCDQFNAKQQSTGTAA